MSTLKEPLIVEGGEEVDDKVNDKVKDVQNQVQML